MTAYALRRLAQALITAAGLALAVALVTTWGEARGPVAWLGGALRLDLGRTIDDRPVASAIAAALPPTALLGALALLFSFLIGWGGGVLLTSIDAANMRTARPTARPARVAWVGRRLVGAVAAPVEAAQGLPIFWIGALLIVLFSLGLGLLPPGGIAAPSLPAFGTTPYLLALRARPDIVVGDLLAHLVLPALTLALAGAATDLRLIRAALPVALHAPHARVARAAGLSSRRLWWRGPRPALPVILGGAAAGVPLAASALILVEYLFGWPGLGLLAYQSARGGDVTTLGALALLFGLAVIVVGLVADLLAAWAEPTLRGTG